MGIEHGGYLENPERERERVEAVVRAAIALGLYVIVDWHDHRAELHASEACRFFEGMAERYASVPNVIFELFNEPVDQSWTEVLRPYHQRLVEVIRERSQALIILGTRNWSQEVVEAARSPVPGSNLAYAVHFYAATHRADLRRRVETALSLGVPLFASEWGTCRCDGDGDLDLEEAAAWLALLERHGISDANWAISDKPEAASAFRPRATLAPGPEAWPLDQLTESGRFVRASLRGELP
uniref:Glycoside hydrolase family 5 domain-containing protein n=1 Tax=Alexandrium catenella TaxID=2925 RepID=A0A7S1MMH0_ALECA